MTSVGTRLARSGCRRGDCCGQPIVAYRSPVLASVPDQRARCCLRLNPTLALRLARRHLRANRGSPIVVCHEPLRRRTESLERLRQISVDYRRAWQSGRLAFGFPSAAADRPFRERGGRRWLVLRRLGTATRSRPAARVNARTASRLLASLRGLTGCPALACGRAEVGPGRRRSVRAPDQPRSTRLPTFGNARKGKGQRTPREKQGGAGGGSVFLPAGAAGAAC